MKLKKFLMTVLVLPCAMLLACCEDDEEGRKGGGGDKTKDPLSQIDDSYTPTQSALQATWAGQYEGWDAIQQANTTIRRKLVLNPNGNYTNVISGQLKKGENDQFFKFESEAGTYKYDESTRTITYTCRYDSVLNYRDESYTVYKNKHYYNEEKATYTEKADFSLPNNGKRVWITLDTYLQSLTPEKLDIAFSMSEYAGDNQQDQNGKQ